MADVVPMHNPGDYKRAMIRIRHLWREGEVQILSHAEERMKERQFETPDIEHCIRLGRILEHKRPGTNWRYTIAGRSVDGDS